MENESNTQLLYGWPTSPTTQPYLEWKGTKAKQYLQAIYTQFKWNFSKLRKFEVYSVHMLSQIFIPSNKWNLETSNHLLVTQDQNPSSSNHKSLVTVTVRHLECLGIIFFLLIRNSLDAVLKVSREPYSTLLPLTANTWHVI